MILPYRVVYVVLIMVGSVASVPFVWAVGTLLNGFMAFPNLVGLAFLLPMVAKVTRDYFKNGGREYDVNHSTTGARVVDTAAGVPGVQP
jgi:Na+/alanine symporter